MKRWHGKGGYKNVLKVGLPLILSMMSTTIMQFTDRIFLGNYSVEALAASVPAGIASFWFISFFMGIAGYVSVFVAQYIGQGSCKRVGASLWQGLYFCIPATLILMSCAFLADILFNYAGHPPEVAILEGEYFRIVCLGSGLAIVGVCFSSFYSGRGMTTPVMVVNMLGALVNIPLDYALINGLWIFPEMGMHGAAVATVCGWLTIAVLYVFMVFSRENERKFGVRSMHTYDHKLMKRFIRYGLPGGVEFFLEIMAFAVFSFLVGRLGQENLAASNIVMSLDLVAFLPLVGLSIATSTLTGQAIGAGQPEIAVRSAKSALHIGWIYMGTMCFFYFVTPEPLIRLFGDAESSADFKNIMDTSVYLLRFVAVYGLMDATAQVCFGVLKGAGDVKFIMRLITIVSIFVMIIPLYLILEYFNGGIMAAWFCLLAYIAVRTIGAILRYRGGKWKSMRVIEGPESEPGQC